MSLLDELLSNAAVEMRHDFDEAAKRFEATVDIGERRQEIVKEFLRRYLPRTCSIGSGEIVDSKEHRSGQVDVVICSPYHPFTFEEKGPGLFFAEGVLGAIEVKSDVSSRSELDRGLKQVQAIKSLERKPMKGDTVFGSKYEIELWTRIPCFIFYFKSPYIGTLIKNIEEAISRLDIDALQTPDAVFVLTKA